MDVVRTRFGDVEYRLAGTGSPVALFQYGGHCSAEVRLGEDYFLNQGFTILAVSRPGYGRTPLRTGAQLPRWADALKELLRHLQIDRVVVVGISAGSRAALTLAARHHPLVDKLILQSAVSFAPWPDTRTRVGAYAAFNPLVEGGTWRAVRLLVEKNPRAVVRWMMSNLSTLDAADVVASLSEQQLRELAQLFAAFRSRRGFLNDINTAGGDACDVQVPTLIVHSTYDRSVPLSHPRLLAAQIKNSHLFLSEAESHMLWFSQHYTTVEKVMDRFLDQPRP
ncbi:MAG: alpha/beta hydrolase [Frankiaceae bacterium]